MSWVKLDDQFITHPKLMRAGPEAALLYVWGLCYSAQHLTDGSIPAAAISLAPFVKRPTAAARTLVSVGLWHDRDGGFEVHDFLEFNPSRKKVLSERDAAAERMRNRRRSSPARSAEQDAKFDDPVPVPIPKEKPIRAADAAPVEPYQQDFLTTWVIYPRKEAKKAALKAYQARRREGVTEAELWSAVTHYAQSVSGKEPEFVMHGSTFFGPNERWKDYLEPASARPASKPQDANGPRSCRHCGKGRFAPGSGWMEACDCLGGKGSGVAA